MNHIESYNPEWIDGNGPHTDVILSTRARLARNLSNYPFPDIATNEDLLNVAQEVSTAACDLMKDFPDLGIIEVEKLSEKQKNYLLDAHLASVDHIKGEIGRLVILEQKAKLSIMVNEEDHIRLQIILPGLAVDDAWQQVDSVDDILSKKLTYGFSQEYGYLTASVSNVGTGLRLSTLMHLAGLALTGKLRNHLKAAYDLGVSIRGLYGEGSRSIGDIFQVSNEITLGISENEIVDRVRSVAEYLLNEEKLARTEFFENQRQRLIANADRSLKLLKNSRKISSEKVISLISPVRLAVSLGIIEDCSLSLFNKILAGICVSAHNDYDASIERANLVRQLLSNVDIRHKW